MKTALSTYTRRRLAGAFSLVEVVVCTAIVSIALVSLYGGISSGFAVINVARENLRAAWLALPVRRSSCIMGI